MAFSLVASLLVLVILSCSFPTSWSEVTVSRFVGDSQSSIAPRRLNLCLMRPPPIVLPKHCRRDWWWLRSPPPPNACRKQPPEGRQPADLTNVVVGENCVFTAECAYGQRIHIRHATWGLGDKQSNVSQVMQTFCNGSSFCRFKVQTGHPLNNDPVNGTFGKELNVTYSCIAPGKERGLLKIVVQEHEMFRTLLCPADKKAELAKAAYGYGDRMVNVTQKLLDRCSRCACGFRVKNELLVDKDPMVGQVKTLTVDYRCDEYAPGDYVCFPKKEN